MPSGRGAASAAISTLPVPTRSSEQLSQVQSPCMPVEIMTAGKLAVTRGSIAVMNSVWAPPPLAPVTPIRAGSTSGKLVSQSIADRIVGLQAHETLQPQLGLRTQQPPARRRVHLRPVRGLGIVPRKGVGQAFAELRAVGVAQHVVMKHHRPHAGQLHAAGLQHRTPPFLEPLFAQHDVLANRLEPAIEEPAAVPMAVRTEDARQPPRPGLGTIQIAGHVETGNALEINFLDRVVAAIDEAVHDRLDRRRRGHGPQSGGHQHLPPHALGPARPGLGSRTGNKGGQGVEIAQIFQPQIVGQRTLRKHPRSRRLERARRHHRRRQNQGEVEQGAAARSPTVSKHGYRSHLDRAGIAPRRPPALPPLEWENARPRGSKGSLSWGPTRRQFFKRRGARSARPGGAKNGSQRLMRASSAEPVKKSATAATVRCGRPVAPVWPAPLLARAAPTCSLKPKAYRLPLNRFRPATDRGRCSTCHRSRRCHWRSQP